MHRPTTVSSLNEAQARYVIIDPALRGAGWNLDDRTQVGFEIPVDGYDAEPWNGVTEFFRRLTLPGMTYSFGIANRQLKPF